MSVTLTTNATHKLNSLLQAEDTPGLKLRVFVSGGGCSGFQYGFTFDEQQDESDLVIQADGIQVLVDTMSLTYLRGAVIDYVEELGGSQFVVKNPNAASTCGCGQSFAPAADGSCAKA